MAMSGKVLGKAIADIIVSQNAPSDVKSALYEQWEKIGNAIVGHIQNNAQVSVNAGIAVSTTGSALAQTGATTAVGVGVVK